MPNLTATSVKEQKKTASPRDGKGSAAAALTPSASGFSPILNPELEQMYQRVPRAPVTEVNDGGEYLDAPPSSLQIRVRREKAGIDVRISVSDDTRVDITG